VSETVHYVVLRVKENQPNGVESLITSPSVPDFRDWTWQVAGGPFCLVTAPDGSPWAFEPDDGDTYWDRITNRVFDTTEHTLLGTIRPIANLTEWRGLAVYAARLEEIRLQAIGSGPMYLRTANSTIKACLNAGKAAYAAILNGTCPALAASVQLSRHLQEESALCGAAFVGTPKGTVDARDAFLWRCHRRAGHSDGCNAIRAASDHCCVPGIRTAAQRFIARPPYDRASFWGYFPEPVEALQELVA